MKNNPVTRQRKPVNKPIEFIEHLELLNLLPENLDEFLQNLSEKAERFRNQEKTLKKIRAKNSKRILAGKEKMKLSVNKS